VLSNVFKLKKQTPRLGAPRGVIGRPYFVHGGYYYEETYSASLGADLFVWKCYE